MRSQTERLRDILKAIAAIDEYVARSGLHDGVVFDAVRMRLIEVGEAVKALDTSLIAAEPSIPWPGFARMRDRMAHRYFDTVFAVVAETVERDLPALAEAARRLLGRV